MAYEILFLIPDSWHGSGTYFLEPVSSLSAPVYHLLVPWALVFSDFGHVLLSHLSTLQLLSLHLQLDSFSTRTLLLYSTDILFIYLSLYMHLLVPPPSPLPPSSSLRSPTPPRVAIELDSYLRR